MKKLIGSVAILALSTSAFAFSTSAATYSAAAFRLIVNDSSILSQVPANESITSIEQVSKKPYEFEVKAGNCTLTVEVSTTTPTGFIGNGLPHDPKVVDANGCN